MESKRPLNIRLGAGLLFGLTALTVYSAYTIAEFRTLRRLQNEVIDRNRRDTLSLIYIEEDLNTLGSAIADMLNDADASPQPAWRSEFQRIRSDLENTVIRVTKAAPANRTPEQVRLLESSMRQLLDTVDHILETAARDKAQAREQAPMLLRARQAAVSSAVLRFFVQNNESDERASASAQRIHIQAERNLYIFVAGAMISLTAVSIYLLKYNRRLFDQVSALSERRGELAQQLISMQESTFRSLSRELHDEFGQILTAVGTMLQRCGRFVGADAAALRNELREVHEIIQATLEKVRALSQALHPVMLEDGGFEAALDAYIQVFERRTGITVQCTRTDTPPAIEGDQSIHLYRVLQEALNNVARHSGAKQARVRLAFVRDRLILEIEDSGVGFGSRKQDGLGLVSMRERAEIAGGHIEFLEGAEGGALVRFTVPMSGEEKHVAAES